jgi:EipB-like
MPAWQAGAAAVVAAVGRYPYVRFRAGSDEESTMTIFARSALWASATALAVVLGTAGMAPAAALTPAGDFASHRAVYDLKLVQTRGKSATVSARGRILYDFTGNVCEGYALQFRQVSELDNGEGGIVLSDLSTATWEEGAAKSFRFNSQNRLNERLVSSVDGSAERATDKVTVKLTKPEDKTISIAANVVFPTEHMRRIIEAARAGKTILELPVFDGTETGEKVYNTLSVIGHPIAPNERVPTDAAAGKEALAGLKRWPVTVSYFDPSGKAGEQAPIYSITFELYENGISRALVLDYNDFVISGELTSLEIRESKPCK